MQTEQNKLSLSHKIVAGASVLSSLTAIILSTLDILAIWDNATSIAIPLLGVTILSQAYTQWNTNRKIAYFNLGAAIFIFICAVVVFFMK